MDKFLQNLIIRIKDKNDPEAWKAEITALGKEKFEEIR